MRETQRATVFYTSGCKKYDPELGRMVGGVSKSETLPCHYSDMGLELKNQLLGKVDVDAKTVRFNQAIHGGIDYIVISNKNYRVLNRQSFYGRRSSIHIGEVQNGS